MRNEQRAESIRQAWAERIAAQQLGTLLVQLDSAGIQITTDLHSFARAALAATALQAMNEYRGHYPTTERKN